MLLRRPERPCRAGLPARRRTEFDPAAASLDARTHAALRREGSGSGAGNAAGGGAESGSIQGIGVLWSAAVLRRKAGRGGKQSYPRAATCPQVERPDGADYGGVFVCVTRAAGKD